MLPCLDADEVCEFSCLSHLVQSNSNRLEAEDLIFQLGERPGWRVTDLSEMDPGCQRLVVEKKRMMAHFMAVNMGGGPHIKTFSSVGEEEGI